MSAVSVVGHDEVWQRLLRMTDRLPPALIFSGPSGIGKCELALAFARQVTGETRALDRSAPLRQTESIFYVAPEGAQIKIDQIKEVLRFLSLARDGRKLVVIINEAHLIGPQAANALLKSVEEPPPGVSFIFIAPSAAMLLATLRSRSQVVRFAALSDADVKRALRVLEPEADVSVGVLAYAAGSVATALEMLRGGDAAAKLLPLVDDLLRACDPGATPGPAARVAALAALREQAKEREAQAMALRFLVRRVAEAWRLRARGLGGTGDAASAGAAASQWLAALDFEQLETATTLALEAEADLSRNVDRQLLWESFASRLASV